jgi:hypothetical protein
MVPTLFPQNTLTVIEEEDNYIGNMIIQYMYPKGLAHLKEVGSNV